MSKKQTKNPKKLPKNQQEHIERHIDHKLSKHLISKTEFFSSQVKQHTATAIIAAFSFLIALSWKDLITHLVEFSLNPELIDKYPFIVHVPTTILITLLAIFGIIFVSKWSRKPEQTFNQQK
jgi:hypothetical protein